MNRLEVILFSFFLLLISFFGISNPGNSFEWLMAAHDGLDALRVVLALVLLSFGIFAHRNNERTIMIFRTAGLIMLGLFAGNALLPDLYRSLDIHIMSLDVVALIEGTVVCILYSFGAPHDVVTAPYAHKQSPTKRSNRRATKPA